MPPSSPVPHAAVNLHVRARTAFWIQRLAFKFNRDCRNSQPREGERSLLRERLKAGGDGNSNPAKQKAKRRPKAAQEALQCIQALASERSLPPKTTKPLKPNRKHGEAGISGTIEIFMLQPLPNGVEVRPEKPSISPFGLMEL